MDRKILTDIHRYWFGELQPPDFVPAKDKVEMWFKQSDETDTYIRDHFGQHIAPAREATWDLKALTREEIVALVVLLDQFPRNIFRTSGEAFASDAKAREIARAVIGDWRSYGLAEQSFLMLPFEHSEAMDDQDFSVMLFADRTMIAPPAQKEMARGGLEYAYKHWAIIRKFGRFPHRNAHLGRESTPDEVEFLKAGRGF